MDDLGDEEDFFDVPVNTLQQLEQEAITSSQHPNQLQRLGLRAASNLGANNAADGVNGASRETENGPAPHPPSSDYGYDEDDVIDLNDPSATFGRDSPPIVAFGASNLNHRRVAKQDVVTSAPESTGQLSGVKELQTRIAELEADRTRFKDAIDSLQTDSLTKDGAIANLRSRNQRSIKDYEARIEALQRLHAEESEKLRAEIRSAKNDQESIKTSNRFLEHDLAEERERLKRLKATASNQPTKTIRPTVNTPKKGQSFAFRDGFDDNEIVTLSPTKPKDEKGTPRAGQKRKRNAIASPASAAGSPIKQQTPVQRPEDEADNDGLSALARLSVLDERVEIIQRVLAYRNKSGLLTLEALSEFKFPDSGGATLGTLFAEALSRLPPQETMPSSVAVRKTCLDLWERCLPIKQYKPLQFILDIFEAMLRTENSNRQVMLHERFIPLVAKTSVIAAEPRVVASRPMKGATENSTAMAPSELVDDLRIIRIFHQVAMSAAIDREVTAKFWNRTEFAFIMLMLHPAQPIEHLRLMLDIVGSSSMEDSFGSRHASPSQQVQQEADLLERITSLLSDVRPDASADSTFWSDALLDLRLQILCTLRTISVTEHGSRAMAQNRTAIGRLSRFACDQVTLLYSTMPVALPTTGQQGQSPDRITTRHDRIIATINLSVRIIHHLLQAHDVVLEDKLSVVHSGRGKLVIALSRIAFSERTILEAGLEDQVVEAANEILDLMVNAEDGESILQVMQLPEGTHSGWQSAGASAQEKE